MTQVIPVTEQTFEEQVKKADSPVLVEFWADWSGPCNIAAPIVQELSEEYGRLVSFGKVDVDSEPGLAMSYEIKAIPTFIVFRNGKHFAQVEGAVPKAVLKKRLDSAL